MKIVTVIYLLSKLKVDCVLTVVYGGGRGASSAGNGRE